MNTVDALRRTAAFLNTTQRQLDAWAAESERGGWSTHQVAANRALAGQCREIMGLAYSALAAQDFDPDKRDDDT